MASSALPHLSTLLPGLPSGSAVVVLLLLLFVYWIGSILYTAFLGPLSKFPGPRLRALSPLPDTLAICSGKEAEAATQLHAKYGPVVRVAPNKLSFAGEKSWKEIYGFRKPGEAPILKDRVWYMTPFNGVASVINRTLKELEPLLQQWVTLFRSKLEERTHKGEKVDMVKWYNWTTFDIMGDLSFNEDLGMLETGEYSDWVKAVFRNVKGGAFIRAVKKLHWLLNLLADEFLVKNEKIQKQAALHWNYSKQRVDRRLAKRPERTDLWTKFIEKQGREGVSLSMEEHYSNAAVFMLAGTETTATALSGTTYYLLRNPTYMNRLVQEIRAAHNSRDDITMESLQHLRYLQAVLQEGLRMYPPVPIALPRVIPKGGATLEGRLVPEDTVVGVSQMALHRSAALFHNPDEFRPERWLGEDPIYEHDCLNSIEPFSTGPRNCLGKNLAWHEMRLILATTLYNFDLHLCDESEGWAEQKVYVLWEKIPLWVRLSPVQQKEYR